MKTLTPLRAGVLLHYAKWLAGDNATLPGALEDCLPTSMTFEEQVDLMDDLSNAITQYVERNKVFHGETPQEIPKVVLLNLSPDELYFVHHLMALGVLAMGGEEAFIRLALAQARAGLKGLGTEAAVSLFDRVNRLSLASFPDAMVIHLSKE